MALFGWISHRIENYRQQQMELENLVNEQRTDGDNLFIALSAAANSNFCTTALGTKHARKIEVKPPARIADEYGNYTIMVSIAPSQKNDKKNDKKDILQVNINMQNRGEEIYVVYFGKGTSETYSKAKFSKIKKTITDYVRSYQIK